MELGLKGRRALITGGSQGIGYAVAEGFLEEGCSVVIASKNEERLRSAVESLSKYGRDRVRGKAIDLSLPGAAAALADAYSDTDILINNAGAIPSGDIFEVDEARWRAAWDLKVFGYINLMRAMFAHMRGHPPKVILNVIGMGCGAAAMALCLRQRRQCGFERRHQVVGRTQSGSRGARLGRQPWSGRNRTNARLFSKAARKRSSAMRPDGAK